MNTAVRLPCLPRGDFSRPRDCCVLRWQAASLQVVSPGNPPNLLPLPTSLTRRAHLFFFIIDEPLLIHNNHSKSIVYLRSMGLDESIMAYIGCCNFTQSIFIVLETLCVFPILLSPVTPSNHWHFCFQNMSFMLNTHAYSVAFLNWLLSCSNMHLGFHHIFSWVDVLLFPVTSVMQLSLCGPWTITRQAPLCPWNFSGRNIGMGCHAFLQGIVLTQGSNPCLSCLLHCRQILYCWGNREAHFLFSVE